jgi:Gluconate 2-dehydrogenase subunit 3
MQRRDFFKALAALSVTVKSMWGEQAPAPQATGARVDAAPSAWRLPVRTRIAPFPVEVPDSFAETQAHFLNDEQLAALRRLSNLFMPPLNNHPGAKDTETPEFLDFLIGSSPPNRQQLYQSGLDRLNTEANKRFGAPFSQIDASQADQLLKPGLSAWMEGHPPSDPYVRFLSVAHDDIRMATMNSQTWSMAAVSAGGRAPEMDLYWSPVDPDMSSKRVEDQCPKRKSMS